MVEDVRQDGGPHPPGGGFNAMEHCYGSGMLLHVDVCPCEEHETPRYEPRYEPGGWPGWLEFLRGTLAGWPIGAGRATVSAVLEQTPYRLVVLTSGMVLEVLTQDIVDGTLSTPAHSVRAAV